MRCASVRSRNVRHVGSAACRPDASFAAGALAHRQSAGREERVRPTNAALLSDLVTFDVSEAPMRCASVRSRVSVSRSRRQR
jgi:hypothetical protein